MSCATVRLYLMQIQSVYTLWAASRQTGHWAMSIEPDRAVWDVPACSCQPRLCRTDVQRLVVTSSIEGPAGDSEQAEEAAARLLVFGRKVIAAAAMNLPPQAATLAAWDDVSPPASQAYRCITSDLCTDVCACMYGHNLVDDEGGLTCTHA